MSQMKLVQHRKIGLGKESDVLLENLAMLVHAGIPVNKALQTIYKDTSSKKMQHILKRLIKNVDEGMPFWKALGKSRMANSISVNLIKSGEDSGRLSENLKLVVEQQQKARSFRSSIRSAIMYPIIVLMLAFIIGISIAWFILPKLVGIFSGLNVDLPLPTRILINVGGFIENNGLLLMLGMIVLFLTFVSLVYWVPAFNNGFMKVMRSLPGIKRLINEVEISRFGYLMGTLLDAGMPVDTVLKSMQDSTNNPKFKDFYVAIHDGVNQGKTFRHLLIEEKKTNNVLPRTVRSLIVAGEESGSLSQALLQISQTYEEKVSNTSKNLSVILEPVLLVAVWLVVVGLALAIILPIYSLISGLSAV